MAPSRRKQQDRDPFEHLADERREAESETPWFLVPDDGTDLEVEAGVSSNLDDDDLDHPRAHDSDPNGDGER